MPAPTTAEPDNKAKILAAASSLLIEGGVAALSVRAISRRAGLSTIAIYSHFQGKQGVLDALYVEGFALVQDATESATTLEDPLEAALLSAERYLEIAQANEGHYRLIFGETGDGYLPSTEAQGAARSAFDALVTQVTRLLPTTSSLGQRQRAALRLWALLHGYVSLRHHVIGTVLDYRQWKSMAMESFRMAANELYSDSAALSESSTDSPHTPEPDTKKTEDKQA